MENEQQEKMGGYRIRPFQMDDRERVEEFFDQMSGESRGFFNRNDGNRKDTMRFFTGQDSNVIRWMAEETDGAQSRMIGYVFLWDTHRQIPWLGIAVREDWKGRHLGRTLLSHAESFARENGYGGILLTTAFANMRGQALYEHCGYEKLGVHQNGEFLYLLRLPQTEKAD